MIAGILRQVQGWVRLRGNTDDTLIGNAGNRLLVDANVSSTSVSTPAYYEASKLNFLAMDASNGGVARNTSIGNTFTNIFSYTGSGNFYGFLATMESTGIETWNIRIVVDSTNYPFFGSTGLLTGDLNGVATYDLASAAQSSMPVLGLARINNSIRLDSGFPIRFNTNISIQIKNTTARQFKMGFVKLEKLT